MSLNIMRFYISKRDPEDRDNKTPDYLIADVNHYERDGRSVTACVTAIWGDPSSISWGSVNRTYLRKNYKWIAKRKVPEEWMKWLKDRAQWWNEGNRSLPYPMCFTCGKQIEKGLYCDEHGQGMVRLPSENAAQ